MPDINIAPEWIAEKAALEGDGEIGAGVPSYIPPFIPSEADRYYNSIIEQYQASVAALATRVAELETENAALQHRLSVAYNVKYECNEEASFQRARANRLDEALLNGNRPLPFGRDELGRMVRESWVRWAETQASPKPSWLVPYEELPEDDKEADRQIGEAIARWTLIGDAARAARSNVEAVSHG